MKIEFKAVSMMELRNSPGEILDRVSKDGEVFVVERSGQPRACLVPVSFLMPDIAPARISDEIARLEEKGQQGKMIINDNKEIEFAFHEIVGGESMIVSITLPHGYPTTAPKIFVNPVPKNTPSRWEDGSIQCFGNMEIWEPKKHNVHFALLLGRRWLKEFLVWKTTGTWTAHKEEQVGN